MLFSEMVRHVSDEEVLATDAGGSWAGLHDWTTRVTKNINLSKDEILYITYKGHTYGNTGDGNVRCLIDDVPIQSTGRAQEDWIVREMYVYGTSGAHAIKFQTARWAGSNEVHLGSVKIAALNFSDKDKAVYDSGSVAAGDGAQTTILSEQTVPASTARKLAVGTIKQYTALIVCYLTGVDYRNSIPRNPADGNEAGRLSWKIFIDGVQKDWTESRHDYEAGEGGNITFGEGAYGLLVIPVDAGSTWKLKIDVYNDTGGARDCRAYVQVLLCPWIIPNEVYQPIDLDFSQGSTFYITLEPLEDDPTKTVKIGRVRFVSHGDSTDYYSTASGTGILSHNYTFETVEVKESELWVGGFGGCISILAVDER